ncbi:uracil-DNA glycosylase family protein [Alteromonas sp. CYL-A6]|uniref:uracil-DNA glycosylase family protein n=1 Tax=Alteromonas nitratireducens TaxID=3390813 RepID=UPI0034A74273
MEKNAEKFTSLEARIRQCQICKSALPYPPNPVFAASRTAKLVIIGQAPGLLAHKTSTPWNDKSGERLRSWLTMTDALFYDKQQVALIPMGFCFPGYRNKADAPPRKECAPAWHAALLAQLSPALTVLVGRYAQQYYQPESHTLTEAVQRCDFARDPVLVLPHPSGRNNLWLARHTWFSDEVLPALQARIQRLFPSD